MLHADAANEFPINLINISIHHALHLKPAVQRFPAILGSIGALIL